MSDQPDLSNDDNGMSLFEKILTVLFVGAMVISAIWGITTKIVEKTRDIDGMLYSQASALIDGQTTSMPQIEKDYLYSEINGCLEKTVKHVFRDTDTFGFNSFLEVDSEVYFDIATTAKNACIEKYVLDAVTLAEATRRNDQLTRYGLSPYTPDALAMVLSGEHRRAAN